MRPAHTARRARSAAFAAGLTGALALSLPGAAVAHDKGFDHPAPSFSQQAPLSTAVNSGGPGAEWELITSIPTGNPHTDIDFFTHEGEKYATVGTLATGPNAGGQSIIQLTQTDEEGVQAVDPSFFAGHPSATCLSNPEAALGLQHDVEATPKSAEVINNSAQAPGDSAGDAQLIIDATDAEGRCHDQGDGGIEDPTGQDTVNAPQGGLELIDVTDLENPVEIGLTSHIGQAHTVNIDPRRPHIAYAVTSDAITVRRDVDDVDEDGDVDEIIRENELEGDNDAFDLDGFEVVDLSSCMNVNDRASFAPDAEIDLKREGCRPEVFRYRYPTIDMSLGHAAEEQTAGNDPTTGNPNTALVYGCHELEIYPDDRLTCGSGAALLVFDMAGAFDDNGTPDDFTDDKPRGEALPCRPRESSTQTPGFATGATVVDCVVGGTDEDPVDLSIPGWTEIGSPSLEGVEWLGSVYHQGRGAGQFGVEEDIDFNHESELTRSGRNLIATDERGGGVTPPGATCTVGDVNAEGNGGIHAYQVDELKTERPQEPEEAFEAYAEGTDGEKAVFRVPVRTAAEGTFCTAHVMQQIPGQNRIFMGWYTQGTQVVDYVELPDGTFEWVEDQPAQEASEGPEDEPGTREQAETQQAGFFIPENANTWVSHIFDVQENEDGTFTYFGATGDFLLGNDGRNTVDVYKVTLPAPATACTLAPESEVEDREEAREVHRPAIDCVLHYDIANGTTDTTYTPTKDVTREQMASFIANAIEAAGGTLPAAASGPATFDDIAGSTHEENIERLAAAGIVNGIGDGGYDPAKVVNREQMASFIVRAARFVTGEAYEPESLDNFSDVQPSNVHAENINAGFEADLFNGTQAPTEDQPGTYAPKLSVQRDQMASFLVNLFTQTIQP